MAAAETGSRRDPANAKRISVLPMVCLFIFLFLVFLRAKPFHPLKVQ
jgi:hypothetical protein